MNSTLIILIVLSVFLIILGIWMFRNKLFKKKSVSILTEEDRKQLSEIQRTNYMIEAKTIMEKRGRELAKRELEIKEKETF